MAVVPLTDLAIENKSWSLKESFEYCEKIASAHYENFPVASRFVPSDKRPYIASIYAFARGADDFADEPGYTTAERIESLHHWEELLLRCSDGEASHPVFVALAEAMERFQIPVELFRNLLTAFRSDVTTSRYATFEEVLEYCSCSANPIGRLVLILFNYRSELMMMHSDAICTALQLTNFWQDVSIDLQKNRLYLPKEDLDQFGVSEDEILQKTGSTRFRKLLSFEVARTERLFREGKPLIEEVGRDLRFELKLTWNGGMNILRKIKLQGFDVFEKRPRLSAMDKVTLLLRTLFV
ncbi:MAG TPA: squalene synthase HpnC [Bacteroidota bacterium]|nr:squalene synthase HpnC [Bacteroidota bacterium]